METWVKEIKDFAVAELRRQKEAAELAWEASLLEEENDDLPKSLAAPESVTARRSSLLDKEENFSSLQDAFSKTGYL